MQYWSALLYHIMVTMLSKSFALEFSQLCYPYLKYLDNKFFSCYCLTD